MAAVLLCAAAATHAAAYAATHAPRYGTAVSAAAALLLCSLLLQMLLLLLGLLTHTGAIFTFATEFLSSAQRPTLMTLTYIGLNKYLISKPVPGRLLAASD